MSNLSKYRKSVVIFSVGVIGLVSLVFDGDHDPASIEGDSLSVHSAQTQSSVAADQGQRVMVVAGNSPADLATDDQSTSQDGADTSANPWAMDTANESAEQPVIVARPDPLPSNITIYK